MNGEEGKIPWPKQNGGDLVTGKFPFRGRLSVNRFSRGGMAHERVFQVPFRT